MSLQLPAILSPPTPCFPSPALTVSPLERSPKLPCPLRVGVRFWASLTLRKLANASGRIVFNIALFMDWQFISGCLPPRLSTTQFPSTTDSQCSVRWGLPPHGWCALSGARRDTLRVIRRCTSKESANGKTGQGKSLSSDRAGASSQKQQKEASRRAAPDARERIPTGAGGAARSYHFYGAYQRFNQKQRPSCQSAFRTLLGQEWR